MSPQKLWNIVFLGAFSLGVLSACQPQEGPAERAGKTMDKAAEKVGEKVEKAGEGMQDAAKGERKP